MGLYLWLMAVYTGFIQLESEAARMLAGSYSSESPPFPTGHRPAALL